MGSMTIEELERRQQSVERYLESLRQALTIAERGLLVGEVTAMRAIITDLTEAAAGNYPFSPETVNRLKERM